MVKRMTKAKELIKLYGYEEASFKLNEQESNDCVVRAVKEAFSVDYIDAHHFCEMKLHRVAGRGTYTGRYLPKIKQAFGKKITQVGKLTMGGSRKLVRLQRSKVTEFSPLKGVYVTKRKLVEVDMKVKDFMKAHPEGRYIITVKGHAFALIDGEVRGNYNDDKRLSKRVWSAYHIK